MTMDIFNKTSNESSGIQPKHLVAALYLCLSLVCLTLEILVLFIVFKINGFILSSFNTFLIGVMATEIIGCLLYACYAVPCIWTESQIYGENMGKFLGNFETIHFIDLVITTFLISLNRALSISGSRCYSTLFRRPMCTVYCILAWIFSALCVSIDFVLDCETVFLEKQFYFTESCSTQPPALTATSLIIYLGVYCVALMYGYAFWKLYKHHKQMTTTHRRLRDNMTRRKRLLFYQALCIWVTLLINVISFRLIPVLLDGLASVLATAFIILGTYYVSPICMLIFSGDIRRTVLKALLCGDENFVVENGALGRLTTQQPFSRNCSSAHPPTTV